MRLKTLCRPSYCLLALVLAALLAAAAHPRSSEGPRDGANGSPQGLASHIPVAQSRQADSTDSADGLQPLQDVATSALQGSFSARRLTSNADTAAADAAHTNSDVTAGDQGGDETHPRRRNAKPTDDDFVVAMPAVLSRFKMALATRVWRQTLRTAIVVEDGSALDALQAEGVLLPSETYMVWPDERVPITGRITKDVRAALIPLMAHRAFGGSGPGRGYKWMLFGDDDTLFYMDNVKKLLRDYDPTLPYMISDNLWWNHRHHNFDAPRCLPCHLQTPRTENILRNMSDSGLYTPPFGCPYCNVNLACQWHWKRAKESGAKGPTARQRLVERAKRLSVVSETVTVTQETQVTQVGVRRQLQDTLHPDQWDIWSRMPHSPPDPPAGADTSGASPMYLPPYHTPVLSKSELRACHHTVVHGGSGVILSVGLMQRLNFTDFVRCVRNLPACGGGDCRFSVCVRDLIGVTFTDPGSSVLAGNDPLLTSFDNEAVRLSKRLPSEAVSRGLCGDVCQWQTANAVSMHIKTRSHHSITLAAAYMFFASHSHTAAQQYLKLADDLRDMRHVFNKTL